MKYKLQLHEHGQMYPDFFQGTPGVQINLYIHDNMTKGKVLDMLKLEFDFQYESITYLLFEAKGKLIPPDLSEKLDELLFIIGSQNDLSAIYNTQAPTEKHLQENDEVNPFIFSLTSKFLD
jgi:hypothetical protein